MESEQQPVESPPQRRSKALPIAITIVLLAIIGGVVMWMLQSRPAAPTTDQTPTDSATEDQGGIYQRNVKFPPQPTEEDEVYSYTGRVLSIEGSTRTLTLATDRGVKQVTITSATTIARQIRPSPAERETLTGEQIAARLAQEFPAERPVQADDTVTVISNINIKGLEQFTATKIIIIE